MSVRISNATLAVAFVFLTCAALAAGNVATHTNFNGQTIGYAYDELNRVKSKTLPGGNTISYTYTATGQVETVTDVRGITHHAYDVRDRLERVEHPEGWVITYGYDAAGNRSSITSKFREQAARTVGYEFDRANRLTKVTSGTEVTSYTYDAAGNRATATLPNGTVTTWTYDARNRLTKVEHKQGATLLTSHTYTWNAQGLRSRVLSVYETSRTCQTDHTYDALGRLTRTEMGLIGAGGNPCPVAGRWTYSYDAVGNRVRETFGLSVNGPPSVDTTFVYDANDRLVGSRPTGAADPTVLTTTYAYDAAGNLLAKTEPPLQAGGGNPEGIPQVSTWSWDAEGRMASFTGKVIAPTFVTPNPVQPKPTAYVYDAEGQLIQEIRDAVLGQQPAPSDITLYLPDKNRAFSQILEERDGAGSPKAAYVFDDQRLIKQEKGGVNSFAHADHLSTSVLSDSAGAMQARYHYDPYGEMFAASGGSAGAQPTVQATHLFAGERLHFVDWAPGDTTQFVDKAAVGLYYNRARWMDPRVGRFLGMDPHPGIAKIPASLHDYGYSANDPVNGRDPAGAFSLGESSIAGNIATTLANIQADAGFSLIDGILNRGDGSDGAAGWGIIASLLPAGTKLLGKTIESRFIGNGKVAILRSKRPLPKEIDAAEHLANTIGAKIYIRGGKSTQGADFFLDGKRWELKVLDKSSTNPARGVDSGIKAAISKNQSNKVVIDGRAAGMNAQHLRDGIANAIRDGKVPAEVMGILKDGTVVPWP